MYCFFVQNAIANVHFKMYCTFFLAKSAMLDPFLLYVHFRTCKCLVIIAQHGM